MERIHLSPEDVWDFILENQKALINDGEEIEIADNELFGISVKVLYDEFADGIFAVVMQDDVEEYSELLTAFDCEIVIRDIYEDYVYQRGNCEYIDSEDRRSEREIELIEATQDFLDVACNQTFFGYEVEDIKDHFLNHLSREYGARIYSPTVYLDEEGESYIEDYPYDDQEDLHYEDVSEEDYIE